MKTIIKDNVVRTVSDKAAKIACNIMGWSELTEAKKPAEVGKRTKPIIIVADNAIPLKEAKVEPQHADYPGDIPSEIKTKPAPTVEVIEPKKTRKPAVKSKSTKK